LALAAILYAALTGQIFAFKLNLSLCSSAEVVNVRNLFLNFEPRVHYKIDPTKKCILQKQRLIQRWFLRKVWMQIVCCTRLYSNSWAADVASANAALITINYNHEDFNERRPRICLTYKINRNTCTVLAI